MVQMAQQSPQMQSLLNQMQTMAGSAAPYLTAGGSVPDMTLPPPLSHSRPGPRGPPPMAAGYGVPPPRMGPSVAGAPPPILYGAAQGPTASYQPTQPQAKDTSVPHQQRASSSGQDSRGGANSRGMSQGDSRYRNERKSYQSDRRDQEPCDPRSVGIYKDRHQRSPSPLRSSNSSGNIAQSEGSKQALSSKHPIDSSGNIPLSQNPKNQSDYHDKRRPEAGSPNMRRPRSPNRRFGNRKVSPSGSRQPYRRYPDDLPSGSQQFQRSDIRSNYQRRSPSSQGSQRYESYNRGKSPPNSRESYENQNRYRKRERSPTTSSRQFRSPESGCDFHDDPRGNSPAGLRQSNNYDSSTGYHDHSPGVMRQSRGDGCPSHRDRSPSDMRQPRGTKGRSTYHEHPPSSIPHSRGSKGRPSYRSRSPPSLRQTHDGDSHISYREQQPPIFQSTRTQSSGADHPGYLSDVRPPPNHSERTFSGPQEGRESIPTSQRSVPSLPNRSRSKDDRSQHERSFSHDSRTSSNATGAEDFCSMPQGQTRLQSQDDTSRNDGFYGNARSGSGDRRFHPQRKHDSGRNQYRPRPYDGPSRRNYPPAANNRPSVGRPRVGPPIREKPKCYQTPQSEPGSPKAKSQKPLKFKKDKRRAHNRGSSVEIGSSDSSLDSCMYHVLCLYSDILICIL